MASRLEKTAEKQMLHYIVLIVVGIVVVVFLVVKFGLQFITNYSLNLENAKGNASQTSNTHSQTYVAPPVINPLPDATNSAQINVSGYALDNVEIDLYVNGKKVDSKSVNGNKTFSFSGVTLQSGQNSVNAKAKTADDQESNFSSDQTISFTNKAPDLTVDSPQDGQTIKGDSHVTVSGKTNPNMQVTVNDFWAIVDDQGKFSYTISLQKGDNPIKVVTKDGAGNTKDKELKVHFDE